MSKRLSIFALFTAWFCASGAMLDVVQVFAWAKMFTRYAEAMPMVAAATETLDPEKACPLCLALRQAREHSEQDQPVATASASEKLILTFQAEEPVVLAREVEPWPEVRAESAPSWLQPVPVPPPRAARTARVV